MRLANSLYGEGDMTRNAGRHVDAVRAPLAVIAISAWIMMLLLAGHTAASDAYTGPFCTKAKLAAFGGFCQSNKVSETRRAVGRSEGGFTAIYIYATNGEELANKCESEGCEVGTGYLKHEDTVVGVIENIGAHAHYYYGYLYH